MSYDGFHLHIELGNEAMQDPEDVGQVLDNVAEACLRGETEGRVMDTNGNTVGSWRFE